jgi:hypothetical protein
MKTILQTLVICFILSISTNILVKAQTSSRQILALERSNPWTKDQLIEPSALSVLLKNGKPGRPLLFNIGAVEDIQKAQHIRAVSDIKNLTRFKERLDHLSKNAPLVIYCGCCPFDKCPNIRPAFMELKKLGFTNAKLLNPPVNLKTNWINKGYPLAESVK